MKEKVMEKLMDTDKLMKMEKMKMEKMTTATMMNNAQKIVPCYCWICKSLIKCFHA